MLLGFGKKSSVKRRRFYYCKGYCTMRTEFYYGKNIFLFLIRKFYCGKRVPLRKGSSILERKSFSNEEEVLVWKSSINQEKKYCGRSFLIRRTFLVEKQHIAALKQ